MRSGAEGHTAAGRISEQILAYWWRSGGTYGSPRLTAALRADGVPVGRRTVMAAMRAAGVAGVRGQAAGRSNRKNMVRVRHDRAARRCVARDALGRRFDVGEPGRCWVADVTLLRTCRGVRFLSVVMDLGSRAVVAWGLAVTNDAASICRCVGKALSSRRSRGPLVLHTDRGGEFANRSLRALLRKHDVVMSMGRRGNCWDNAAAESLFGTFKREWYYRARRPTVVELEQGVAAWVEWYNNERLHSALGWRSPMAWAALWTAGEVGPADVPGRSKKRRRGQRRGA